jgi:uncharacterized protein YdaU (DUF1376 family)
MANRPDIFMPLMVGDYLKDTGHLTTEQHGAYLLLLMAYWARGGALVADDARLAATARMTPQQWAKNKPVLAEFFSEADGLWVNKRSEEELAQAQRKMEAKAKAGSTGANARWQKDSKRMATALRPHKQKDGRGDATAMANRCPSPSPSHNCSSEQLARAEEFEVFWEAYPKRPGDPEAQAEWAWQEMLQGDGLPPLAEILAAIKRWAAARAATGDEALTPYARTWLLEKRWQDWPAPPPPEPHKRDWADAYPDTWGKLKAATTPNEWAFWLGKCTINGLAHVLYTPDNLTREKVEQKYGTQIRAMFGDKGTVRVMGERQGAAA